MSSYRTQIAEAVKAQLLGKTKVDNNIYTTLDRALQHSDLPAIVIYTTISRRGKADNGDNFIPRLVTVVIEAAVVGTPAGAQVDAANLAEEIENAMEADESLGNVVNDCEWQESVTDVNSIGSVTIGVALVQYQVEILTNLKPDNYYEGPADGFTAPPTKVSARPSNSPTDFSFTFSPQDIACGPDGCDIPAWDGDNEQA